MTSHTEISLHDIRERTERALSILKASSTVPLEIARREALRKEWKDLAPGRSPVGKMIEYFTMEWLNGHQLYALGPAVMSLSCEAVGGDPAETASIAAVITLMGGGAEILDDVIDNSQAKNSRLTVFGKFGSSMAILAGSMYLVKGFALLNRTFLERNYLYSKAASVNDAIVQAIFEHANAECLALKLKKCSNPKPDKYIEIIKMRSAVIEAQARIGVVLGGGNNGQVEALGKYGRILGTLSLMRRELADTFEIHEAHHRIFNECPPLPLLYAFESPIAKKKLMRLIRKDRPTGKDVNVLADIVFETRKVRKMIENMKKMVKEANASIAEFKSESVESLKLLTWLTICDLEHDDATRPLSSIRRNAEEKHESREKTLC